MPAAKNSVQPEQSQSETTNDETFNPWSVVNLVFEHLAGQGLLPTLTCPRS